jgi:hypothetical protein
MLFFRGGVEDKKSVISWVPGVHACNPSHSGGRDQEDRGLKPALGK